MTAVARVLFCVLPLLAGPALAGPFSALYVLGDSQSDSGNAAILSPVRAVPPYQPVPPGAYLSGRLSDGPVWAEFLAARLGVSAVASFAGGTNSAIATARIVDERPAGTHVPSLTEQAGLLLTGLGGALPPDALFAVWGGANDSFAALESADPEARIGAAITGLDAILRGMAAAGAAHFLVLNLGDSGLTPLFAGTPFADPATMITTLFNTQLTGMLTALLVDFPGLDLKTLDMFTFSHTLASNPAALGLSLTNTTDPCLIFGTEPPAATQCADPDQYAFWDALHSTSAVHEALGRVAYRLVPVPASLPLLGLGLLLLVPARRRQARQIQPRG